MARPPHSSLAPSFFPLSISSRILSNCFWSICQTQKEKKQTAAPLLSWFQRGVMECGPGARLQGTVKLGQFTAQFRMWQSGSEQGEGQDMGTALSHRKLKVKWSVTAECDPMVCCHMEGSPFPFLPVLDMFPHTAHLTWALGFADLLQALVYLSSSMRTAWDGPESSAMDLSSNRISTGEGGPAYKNY